MKILIVSTFFPPQNSIASLRPYSWAKYWTLEGHDVTILTTAKNPDPSVILYLPNPGYELIEVPLPDLFYNLKEQYHSHNKEKKIRYSSKIKNSLRYILQHLKYDKGIFNACRMPDSTDFWVKRAYRAVSEQEHYDLVVSTAGPYTTHLIAHKLKKKGKAKYWIADYRDTWSNNYIYPGLYPFNRIEKYLEKKVTSQADIITTISAPFARNLENYLDVPKVHVIENGFDPEDLKTISDQPIFLKDGKFRIVHTGTIYKNKRDPSPLFQAIRELSLDPQYSHLLNKLEVLFAGADNGDLEELINKHQVKNWVRMSGFISRENALRMQRDAHALLFLPWSDPSVQGVLTGKIFEYLYSQTPIIAVGGKGLESSQLLVQEANAGQVLDKIEDIKKFLVCSLKEPKKRSSNTLPQILERYTRKRLANRLLDLIKDFAHA